MSGALNLEGGTSDTWSGAQSTDVASAGNWINAIGSVAVMAPGTLDTAAFSSGGGTISGIGTVANIEFTPFQAGGANWFVAGSLDATNLLAIGSSPLVTNVTVANGGALASQGFVNVGDNGNATIDILAGGTMQAFGSMDVGDFFSSVSIIQGSPLNASATGTVNVAGSGAIFDVGGSLVVGGPVTGALTVSNGGEVVAGNVLVGTHGDVVLSGGVFSSQGTIDNAGTIALSGALAGGVQVLSSVGTVTNTGVIVAAGSSTYRSLEEINNSIYGTGGTLDVGNEADLQLDDAVGSGQVVDFLSPGTGGLILFDPGAFAAAISGFQAGDDIDVVGATSGTLTGNVLTLYANNNQIGTIDFAGAPTELSYYVQNGLLIIATNGTQISPDITVTTISGGSEYAMGSQNDALQTPAGNNSLVVMGSGSDTVTAEGSDTILAGSGPSTVSVASASSQNLYASALVFDTSPSSMQFINGSNASTIVAGAGSGALYVTGRAGPIDVWGGSGSLYAIGEAPGNVLVAGSGNATLIGGGNGDLFVGGSSTISGAVTVVDTVGLSTVFGGASAMSVTDGAAATVVGGGGALSVVGGANAVEVWGGGGGTNATGGSGGGNILVSGSGASTLTGGGNGDLFVNDGNGAPSGIEASHDALNGIFVSGASTTMITTKGDSTIFGGAGSTTVVAGGSTTTIGGSGVMNLTNGPGNNVVFGGSINPETEAVSVATINETTGTDYVIAGSEPMTINGASGPDTFTLGLGLAVINEGAGAFVFDIINGQAGGDLIINGFKVGIDQINATGYGDAAIASAVANATITSAGMNLSLPDGTRIMLAGVTNLGSSIQS